MPAKESEERDERDEREELDPDKSVGELEEAFREWHKGGKELFRRLVKNKRVKKENGSQN